MTEIDVLRSFGFFLLLLCVHQCMGWLYDTMRYDSVYLTCSKKLTGSQLGLLLAVAAVTQAMCVQ